MIDSDIQKKMRERYNPDGSDLRKAQLRMVDMLRFLDSVCRKNNITYWLDSGTLLGAVRHGGFIPWDDDIDVCMPIEDLRKFKNVMLKQQLNKEMVLQCHETDFYYLSTSWYVLRDLKSEYIQNSNLHNVRKYKGLQVDLFGVESNILEGLHFLSRVYQHKLINGYLAKDNKKIAYFFFLPFRYFFIPIFRALSFFSRKKYYKMGYGIPIGSKRFKDSIFPISEIEFENYMFKAPANPQKYLTTLYKNWSQIPEENKIITHDVQFKFY